MTPSSRGWRLASWNSPLARWSSDSVLMVVEPTTLVRAARDLRGDNTMSAKASHQKIAMLIVDLIVTVSRSL